MFLHRLSLDGRCERGNQDLLQRIAIHYLAVSIAGALVLGIGTYTAWPLGWGVQS